MAKIQDIRHLTPKRNTTRPEANIIVIVRHHSASSSGDFWTFWHNTWKKLGWAVGGYHEIILRDGTVQLCYDPDMITNGVAGHNSRAYHICVVGNGSFTSEQEKAFDERAKAAMARFNLPVTAVKGHGELAPSACPGIDMNFVRQRLSTAAMIPVPKFANVYGKDCRRYVCKGVGVKELQIKLLTVGEKLPRFGDDGHFGEECEAAVKSFQRRHGLAADGIAGPATLKKLDEEVKKVNEVIAKLEKRVEMLEKQLAVQNMDEPSDWAKKDWQEAVENGYFDGMKPRANFTREQAAVVVNRLRHNFLKLIGENKERIEQLEKQLRKIEKSSREI